MEFEVVVEYLIAFFCTVDWESSYWRDVLLVLHLHGRDNLRLVDLLLGLLLWERLRLSTAMAKELVSAEMVAGR